MTDLRDLNKNTPATRPPAGGTDSQEAHRRIENEANKDAQKGKDRQREEDQGEFSNVGPV